MEIEASTPGSVIREWFSESWSGYPPTKWHSADKAIKAPRPKTSGLAPPAKPRQ